MYLFQGRISNINIHTTLNVQSPDALSNTKDILHALFKCSDFSCASNVAPSVVKWGTAGIALLSAGAASCGLLCQAGGRGSTNGISPA